jgi:hypothetical protein
MAKKTESKSKPKAKLYVDAVSIGGRIVKVSEDNLDYCVELKSRGRSIKDPHGLLKNHPQRKYIFDE